MIVMEPDKAICPLCNIPTDEVIQEFQRFRLCRTKTMKGHRERLMLYSTDHVKNVDEQSLGEAYLLLMIVGTRAFSYATHWAVFEPAYATVPEHWHRVASDLDPSSQDYNQILKTPRLIIDNEKMTVNRGIPEKIEHSSELPPSKGTNAARPPAQQPGQ